MGSKVMESHVPLKISTTKKQVELFYMLKKRVMKGLPVWTWRMDIVIEFVYDDLKLYHYDC